MGSPDPRFPPYVVRTLLAPGAPAYGGRKMGCQEKKINAIVVVWLGCSRWMDDGMSEKTMDGWMHGWMEERILMVLKPLGCHGVPKWPWEWSRDPRGCPAEGNDDARETLRTQWFGGQAPLKPLVFMYILHMRSLSENWSKTEARRTLRRLWFRGHGRLF